MKFSNPADAVLVAEALERAATYRLLGAAFRHPTEARLAEGALGAAAAGPPPAAAAEHAFLFGRAQRCAPWESVYGEPAPFADAAACVADVVGFYETFGAASAAEPEMEDHIAAELEFMGGLALREACALAGDAPATPPGARGGGGGPL